MSLENLLARCSLLHLKDNPEKLEEELKRRILLADRRTREEIEEDNKFDIENGEEGIDVDKYIKERDLAKRENTKKKV